MGSVAAPLVGHVNAPLTNFAKKFMNNERIASRIAPVVLVSRQSDLYWIYGREGQELTERQLRATGAGAEAIRLALSSDTYFCRSHALKANIADEDRQGYADAGDIEMDAVQAMMDKIDLQREDELATKLGDTAQVTNNVTIAAPDRWDNSGGSPFDVIETGKSKIRESGVRPNFIAMGEEVYRVIINHAGVIERIKYAQRAVPNEIDLAAIFGVDEVLIGRAVKMVGATPTFVWGKNLIIGYRSPSAGRQDISGVKTFRWSAAPGTSGGIGVVKDRNPDPTAKSDIVGVDDYYDQKITAVETLYLVKTPVN